MVRENQCTIIMEEIVFKNWLKILSI